MISIVISLFLLLHLVAGAVVPVAKDPRPVLFSLIQDVGAAIARKLDRPERNDLGMRGFIAVAGVTGVAALGGCLVRLQILHPYAWLGHLVFLALCASLMAPLKVLRATVDALGKDDTLKAAAILQPSLREPLDKADAHTLARRAVEWSAASLDVYFLAPLFWFWLAGPPAMAVSVALSALRSPFGRGEFGGTARVADKVFNIAPAFLTAIIIAVSAAFVSRSSPARSLSTAFSQWRKYKSGVLGLPIAAMAGALGVTLGGPVRVDEHTVVDHGWIGPVDSSAKLSAEQLQRCAMVHFVFFLCVMVAFSVTFMLKFKKF